jgi:uncharacterized membrane protein YesL
MFGFLIKKCFFDMWDNLFRVIIMNLGFLIVLAIFFLLAPVFLSLPGLFFTVIAIGVAALSVYTGVVSRMTTDIADYKQPGFSDSWAYLKETWKGSLLVALCAVVYGGVLVVAFRFYGGLKSAVGPLAVSLLFWVTVGIILAAQYLFPVRSRLDRSFRKVLRKSFLLFFDNPAFSIGLLIGALLISGISVFTALLLPGLATLLLWWNAGLKLRLYKYDWLEQNPDANRRRVPWDALLVEDRERVGKRTLKGMIFPWKE